MTRQPRERDPAPSDAEWRRLEELLEAGLDLPESARRELIERASDGDPAFRRHAEALFAAHDSEGVLDRPIVPYRVEDDESGAEFAPGTIVAHYEIRELLGRGGMGVVYRAHDLRLDRRVALKFLPASRGVKAEAKARFLIEARAAAALEHPNVCSVHEIGETTDGRLYIAMAYIEGESLRERMDRGPLPVTLATRVARDVARALACAHAHGIVHRDVKPANVMLGSDDVAKLVDFGVAKLEGAALTDPGVTPGTTAYMSPEQVRGEEVDFRTDLWALGVLLYEMLAGSRPFVGDSSAVTRQAIITGQPPSLRRVRSEVSAALESVVARALRKRREERHESAQAFEFALQRAAPLDPPALARGRFVSSRPWAVGAALLIVLLAAGFAWIGKVGRPGTLFANDVLAQNDLVLVSEFQNRTDDSSLAATVTDAVRVELQQSRAVRVMSQAAMWAGLDRMGLSHDTSLPQQAVRELAEREGAKAFIVGDIARLGRGYQVSARVIATATGNEALVARSTASNEEELIGAVESVGRTLRRGIGESLRSVMNTPPLADYTTPSLPALRALTSANRAEQEGNRLQAIALAKEALAIDTSFAAAWEVLFVAYGNTGAVHLAAEAAERAYLLRARLPEVKRLRVEARYHRVRGDRVREEAAFKLLAAMGEEEVNYTDMLMAQGRLPEAELMARRAVVSNPTATAAYWNLAETQVANQRFAAAESTLALMATRMPDSPYRYWLAVSIPYGRRDFDAVEQYVRSSEGAQIPTRESYQCLVDVQRGRIHAWRRCPEPEVWVKRPLLALAQFRLTGDTTWARAGYAGFLASAADDRNLDDYPATIALLAETGHVRQARQLLDEWRTRAGESDPGFRADSAQAVGAVAAAEGRWEQALAAFRAWNRSVGTSSYHYYNRGLAEAAFIYRRLGNADSATVLLERALAMPSISGGGLYEAGWYVQALEMLGDLHAARGDRTKASAYYRRYVEVLAAADSPIAERVAVVRARLEELSGEGGRR